jgi:hypothetical protein
VRYFMFLATALVSFSTFSTVAQEPPAPPAPPSPLEGALIDCVAQYAASNYSKPGDSFELGSAVLKACRTQADAVVANNIQSQAAVGGLRRTDDTEAKNDNTRAAVYFQAQRYATMRIIQRRSDARRAKGGL